MKAMGFCEMLTAAGEVGVREVACAPCSCAPYRWDHEGVSAQSQQPTNLQTAHDWQASCPPLLHSAARSLIPIPSRQSALDLPSPTQAALGKHSPVAAQQ